MAQALAGPADQGLSLKDPQIFRSSFSVEGLLVSLAKDVITTKAPPVGGASAGAGAGPSLERVQKLLQMLDRCVMMQREYMSLGKCN